jgi:hypothetical protein
MLAVAICFPSIIFYRFEIYCPIYTRSSTMPSLLYVLCSSIIGLRCFLLLTCIRIATIVTLIHIDIPGWLVEPLEHSHGASSLPGIGDGIALVPFVTFILAIPAASIANSAKLTIGCAIYTCIHAQHKASISWTPVPCAAHIHLYSIERCVLVGLLN